MNLLKGFAMRSDKARHTQSSDTLGRASLSRAGLSGELTLEEMLSDPVIKSMMQRDHVSSAEIIRIVRRQNRAAA
jgi:hypothetical protein